MMSVPTLTVTFRVVGGESVGAGHIARCAAVARALSIMGGRSTWVCDAATERRLQDWGVAASEVVRLRSPATQDAIGEELADEPLQRIDAEETVSRAPADWFVVDAYALGAPWHMVARSHGRVAVFDDFACRLLDADLVVNAAADPGSYRTLAPRAAELCGLKAAVVGNDGQPPAASAGSLLVAFGADDPLGLTKATLECLAASGMFVERKSLQVVVQMSNTAAGRPAVEQLVATMPGWRMAPSGRTSPGEPMLAIGAAGVSLLERMHAGVPSVVIIAAPNQRALAKVAMRTGSVVVEDSPHAASAAAFRLLDDPTRRSRMSAAARAAVDGRGAERLARLMNRMLGVVLRPAAIGDALLLHQWRNHPDVRRVSLTTEEIAWEDHLAWLESSLQSKDRYVLVAERRGHPLGTLRFDVTGDCATVSIVVSPNDRGLGYGPAMLDAGTEWLRANNSRVKRLRAVVRSENAVSERAFLAAGYARGTDSLERMIEEGSND